jgi:hypothetical protein
MRSNFTYSLNEENIRRQLREQSAPLKEEAWQKFSAYSEAHARPVAVRKFPKLNLQLNRKFMMPVAAAAALILVTVLLLNVVNFKPAAKKTAVNAASAEPFVPMPQLSEPETLMSMSQRSRPEQPVLTQNVPALQPDKPQITSDKAGTAPQETGAKSAGQGSVSAGADLQALAQPKKKARVQAPDIEPAQLQDIRPTVLSPEQEEDIRPN